MINKKDKDYNDELKNNVVWSCPEHGLQTYFKVKEYEATAKEFVYVRFFADDQYESMWVKIRKGTQQQGYGELNNIPVKLVDRKLGETVSYRTNSDGITLEVPNA